MRISATNTLALAKVGAQSRGRMRRRMTHHWLMILPLWFSCAESPVPPAARGVTANPSTTTTLPAAAGAPAPPLFGGGVMPSQVPAGAPAVPVAINPAGSCNQDVDVVFVLDVSGSMIPPLTTLEREVSMIDASLKGKNLPSPARYGLVVFVDGFIVMNGGMPYSDVNAIKAELLNQVNLTNQMPPRQLNGAADNLTWPENSLDALYAAATQFQWRPVGKTLRTVILITDASFWDGTAPSSGHDFEQNPLFPAHVSMNSYDQTIAKLREQQIWVNTFAAKTGGPPDGMVSPPSHGEWRGTSVNVGIGFFEPYKGKPSIADSTGGFAWDIDEVFEGKVSLATPINQAIEARQCEVYPS